MKNIIILGSGIAGCTAAVYTARADLRPLIISGPEDGGQLMLTTKVENFPGFPEGVQGPELVEKCKKQAEQFGARFKIDIAMDFNKIGGGFELTLMSGEKVQTKTLIAVTGASARWLGIPSEEKYKGRGVTTCATCDGAFFKDKEVIVIGGGDSAMEEATFLTRFANKVTIIHRRDTLRASKIMQEKAKNNPKIRFIWNSVIEEILGDGKFVRGVKLKDVNTNKVSEFKCDGVFLAIGHVPNTKIFKDKLEMNEQGYLKTDKFMHTNIPGVFAAGDVQDIRFKQAITAAGSGCMAAMEAEKYLAEYE
ncbi:MAG: thioredoxin-disulfide reductase [Nanoarchaeota archaeon]|nr:thioredoxin-disulfide reductase [Nanoarchaeota archaeon]MBU1632340.1 thioredoxin-disulfide reductase [Nanoarchaeota archaeon]MBU1875772.1 thioredoxin-disulfide reductase [Nanoarchaeota archaeon]